MRSVFQSAVFEALGWSLIDSLWQTGCLWILYIITTRNGRKFSAQARHNFAYGAMTFGTIWLLFTFFFNHYQLVHHRGVTGIGSIIQNNFSFISLDSSISALAIPFLSLIYVLALGVMLIKMFSRFRSSHEILNRELYHPGDFLSDYLYGVCENFGISRKVTLWLSDSITSPVTIGFIRPLIYLPVTAVTLLSPSQVEALIIHELQHIRRNDYVLNIGLMVMELILFFNPFARIFSGIIRKEREHHCDDVVVSEGFDNWDYSQALYVLGKNQTENYEPALAATGNSKQLLNRVRRMMKLDTAAPSVAKPLSVFFLCLVISVFASMQPGKVVEVVQENKYEVINIVKPVVYYAETRREPVVVKSVSPSIKKKVIKTVAKKIEVIEKVVGPSPPPAPPVPFLSFASDEETIEFSIIDHKAPFIAVPVNIACPLPYVPGSTFSTPFSYVSPVGRKVVIL